MNFSQLFSFFLALTDKLAALFVDMDVVQERVTVNDAAGQGLLLLPHTESPTQTHQPPHHTTPIKQTNTSCLLRRLRMQQHSSSSSSSSSHECRYECGHILKHP